MKKSFNELALQSKKALLIGMGGGGDIIQGIPVKNYLKQLGVKDVYLAGVACEWWPFDAETPETYLMAPTVYPIEDLKGADIISPNLARVNENTKVYGKEPAEAKVAGILGEETYIVGARNGVQGMLKDLQGFVHKEEVDLVVGMDVGSDSVFSGETEIRHPRTPLVDFLTLATLTQLSVDTVYALAGYGCDGELELEDLEANIGVVMKNGGFLGAYGLTPLDVEDMEKACAVFPDPVEKWPYIAAKGDFGLKNMKLMEAWGCTVRLTPLTAITLFFDPGILVEYVSRYAGKLISTRTLKEAEEILISLDVLPETRLPKQVNFLQPHKE